MIAEILIAYVIFAWALYGWDQKLFKAVFWIFDVEFWYHVLIGAIGLLTMAFLDDDAPWLRQHCTTGFAIDSSSSLLSRLAHLTFLGFFTRSVVL